MRREQEDGFREFAIAQAAPLRRCAYLFCGDWHLAEDLMQTALVKIYRAWPRIEHQEATGNYARRVLLRTWLDEKRRPWRRAEVRHANPPDQFDEHHPTPDAAALRSETRALVHRALLLVPPRQRAVLVLRYFDDLSIVETAAAMACSTGTVKSQAARGLANLKVAMTRVSAAVVGAEPANRKVAS